MGHTPSCGSQHNSRNDPVRNLRPIISLLILQWLPSHPEKEASLLICSGQLPGLPEPLPAPRLLPHSPTFAHSPGLFAGSGATHAAASRPLPCLLPLLESPFTHSCTSFGSLLKCTFTARPRESGTALPKSAILYSPNLLFFPFLSFFLFLPFALLP